jgi:hypothetical protein
MLPGVNVKYYGCVEIGQRHGWEACRAEQTPTWPASLMTRRSGLNGTYGQVPSMVYS